MRQGQSKRIRGRSRGGGGGNSGGGGGGSGGKGPNPLTRSYESNGPDVKIRGTAGTIADKYVQLSRDALTAGDPVAAENYMQHAEHYYRLLAAAQAQYQPHVTLVRADADDFGDVDMDDDGGDQPETSGQPYSNGAPQPQGGGQPGQTPHQARHQHGGRPNGYDQNRQRDDQRRPYNDRADRRPYERQDAGAPDQNRQPEQNRQRDHAREPDPNRPYQNRQAGERDDRRPERGDRPARQLPDEQPAMDALPAFITGSAAAAAPAEARPAQSVAPAGPPKTIPAPVEPAPEADAVSTASGDDEGSPMRGGRRRRYGRRAGGAAEDGAPAEGGGSPPDAASE